MSATTKTLPRPPRSIRIGEEEWAAIQAAAAAAGEDVSAYLRRRALEPESASRRDVAAAERRERELRTQTAARLEAIAAELREAR